MGRHVRGGVGRCTRRIGCWISTGHSSRGVSRWAGWHLRWTNTGWPSWAACSRFLRWWSSRRHGWRMSWHTSGIYRWASCGPSRGFKSRSISWILCRCTSRIWSGVKCWIVSGKLGWVECWHRCWHRRGWGWRKGWCIGTWKTRWTLLPRWPHNTMSTVLAGMTRPAWFTWQAWRAILACEPVGTRRTWPATLLLNMLQLGREIVELLCELCCLLVQQAQAKCICYQGIVSDHFERSMTTTSGPCP